MNAPGRVTRPGAKKILKGMAGPTRLELATSGVTGRRSNQLNYDPASGLATLPMSLTLVCQSKRLVSEPREKTCGRYRI